LNFKISHTVRCSLQELGNIRTFVSQQLKQLRLSPIEHNQVILAVDEACANAIIHGNNCDKRKRLKVDIAVQQDTISIEVHDIGQYRPNEATWKRRDLVDKNIQHKRKGGLGLTLIHRVMDSVNYFNRGRINVCSLTKKINRS